MKSASSEGDVIARLGGDQLVGDLREHPDDSSARSRSSRARPSTCTSSRLASSMLLHARDREGIALEELAARGSAARP
jgi:hypothetical protein